MAERSGFKFYIIEAIPLGYGNEVRYYQSGKGYVWRRSPHEATFYVDKSWAEKRVKAEKKVCSSIRILTYDSSLTGEESYGCAETEAD